MCRVILAPRWPGWGFTPDYVPVNGPLPAYPLNGRYAGIVSWINSDEPEGTAPYADWLEQQVEAGIPLAVFSRFGLAYDAPLLRRLGLRSRKRTPPAPSRLARHPPPVLKWPR